jgi:hypothetical protein
MTPDFAFFRNGECQATPAIASLEKAGMRWHEACEGDEVAVD